MQTLDLIGISALEVSGALMSIRHDFDVVERWSHRWAAGSCATSCSSTAAPGVHQVGVLVVSLAAAVAFVAHPWLVRLGRPLLVFDAAGLGLLSVAGAEKALDLGSRRWPPAASGARRGGRWRAP